MLALCIEDQEAAATPLHIAAESGQASIVQMLLKRGADPALAGSYGRTAVWHACSEGHVAVLRILHACGVDLEQSDEGGSPPPPALGV